jgi:hypothetical protein
LERTGTTGSGVMVVVSSKGRPKMLSRCTSILSVFAFCYLLSVAALSAQSDKDSPSVPKDVDGWGKVKWGMTLEAVQTTYGSEVKDVRPDRGMQCLTLLNKVKVADIDLGVYICAPRLSDPVRKVELGTVVESAGDRIHSTLKTLLIEKYGAPTNEQSEHPAEFGTTERSSLWVLPSTSITLLTANHPGVWWLTRITYEPRVKNPL